MQSIYALLFYQLLFPMCGMGRSVIRGDIGKSYYCKLENFSNIYGMQLGIGGEFGYNFINISLYELVRWDGVLQRDGVRGGSSGDMY